MGGSGGWYSFNYDRLIHDKYFNKYSFRGGVNVVSDVLSSLPGTYYVLTMGASKLLQVSHRVFFELGPGLSLSARPVSRVDWRKHIDWNFQPSFNPIMGLRLQKQEGGFFFRLTHAPFITLGQSGSGTQFKYYPRWGVSYGKTLTWKR